MYITELLMGLIMILAGLLVKPYPNLIAGYNMLTQAQKEKFNLKKYAVFMGNTLIGLGIVVILIGIIMKWFEVKQHYSVMVSTTLIVLTVLYISFKGGAFIKKK